METIEINRYYSPQAELVFEQYIFWEDGKIRDWVIVKEKTTTKPVYNPYNGYWSVFCTKNCKTKEIRALYIKRTWTQYDPEVEARTELPEGDRRKIFK